MKVINAIHTSSTAQRCLQHQYSYDTQNTHCDYLLTSAPTVTGLVTHHKPPIVITTTVNVSKVIEN